MGYSPQGRKESYVTGHARTLLEVLTHFSKFFLKINLFIFALHGLFLVAENQGFSLVAVCRLLIVIVSLVGFRSAGFSGLICPEAYGIFSDQGSNPCPLNWQDDS